MSFRNENQFLRAMGGGLAAAVDLRLPSGDPHNLLGTGGTQVKALFVASDDRGRVGHHANVGYTAASGSVAGMIAGLTSASISDELNYSGGVEFVASPRLTLLGDFVGRNISRGAGRLKVTTKAFEYDYPLAAFTTTPDATISCGGIVGNVCRTAMFDELDPRPGNLNLLLGTVGMKFNPFGNWLISGSVLFPLTDAGLRSRVTTVIGNDYAFEIPAPDGGKLSPVASERWQHVEQLYHAALAQSDEERAAFLRDACGGDDELREEVESLLTYDRDAETFLAAAFAPSNWRAPQQMAPGQRFGLGRNCHVPRRGRHG